MRVLIIQPWISYRGAETLSINQARGLKTLGHQAAILALFIDWEHLDILAKDVTFITPGRLVSSWCRRSNLFLFAFGFVVMLILLFQNARRFELLNPHNFPSLWAAVLVGGLLGKRVVWTVHNFPQHGFTQPTVKKIWGWGTWWLDQRAVAKVDQVIAVSAKVARQVEKFYLRKAQVIWPGLDDDLFRQGRREEGRRLLAIKDRYLLYPAKLNLTKNHLLLLFALKRLKGVKLVIAGEGKGQKTLAEEAERLGLTRRVVFLGYLAKEQLRHLYAAADLLVVPAQFGEGFSLAVLEGLACGVVPVVVQGSGIDEWVREQRLGWVAEPNPESLASVVDRALRKPAWRRAQAARGRALIRTKHSLKAYAHQWLEAVREEKRKSYGI